MDNLVIAVAIAAVVIILGIAAMRIFAKRMPQAHSTQQMAEAASHQAAQATQNLQHARQVLASARQATDEFNLADYTDDRSGLVNELLIESERVTRQLEHVSNALREDVSTIAALNDKIVWLQGELSLRDQELQASEKRYSQSQNDNFRAQEEIANLSERNDQLELELARKASTLDSTKEMLLVLENSSREMAAQNSDLKNEVQHLNEDLQSSQARIADLTATLEYRDMEMQRVNLEISNSTSERNRANLAEAKISRLMTQIEELKAESKNEIDRFRAERDILKLKFDQAQDAIESQRQRMSETERNRERVSSQLEILRNELSTHRAEANARTQSLEAANRELSSHVQVLERILEQYRNRPSSNSDGKKTKPPAPGTAPEAAKLRVVSRDGDPS